jgi:adenine-specific DNA-methyltransferase
MPTLHWIGKEKVVNHHRDVPFRVLEKEYEFNLSADHTTSENKIIHGDNLEALKSLLPEFEGRVNCIYMMVFDQKEVKGAFSFDKAKALIREM